MTLTVRVKYVVSGGKVGDALESVAEMFRL